MNHREVSILSVAAESGTELSILPRGWAVVEASSPAIDPTIWTAVTFEIHEE